jgi:dipeptide/tripeptide permease
MAVRDGRVDVKQTTTGFRGPLMVQSLTSGESIFLSLIYVTVITGGFWVKRFLGMA